MIIEFDSVEYATKVKWTVGILIDQFQQAVRHVVMAKAQSKYPNGAVAEAVKHYRSKMNDGQCQYTFICDYAPSMNHPELLDKQTWETYCFTPCSIYIFGMVDCAHAYVDEKGIP